jgi:hypothetical protein
MAGTAMLKDATDPLTRATEDDRRDVARTHHPHTAKQPTGYPAEWIEEYHRRRDYQHLSKEQLSSRHSALLENMIEFDQDGKPFIKRDTLPRWSKRLCWTELEFVLRGSAEVPQELQRLQLARCWPHVTAARRLWSRIEAPSFGSYIVKFSEREYVQEMLATGRFQISPAKKYRDPSLNAAIHDDELHEPIFLPAGTKLKVKLKPDEDYTEIPGIAGAIRFNRQCDNFFVFCAAGRFDPRLFDEFNADACLLVRDLRKFGLALIHGAATALGATHAVHGSVHYSDPCHREDSKHLVEITKNFRYEYQKEWRIAWRGPAPLPENAEPVFVELGSLCESCEALYL